MSQAGPNDTIDITNDHGNGNDQTQGGMNADSILKQVSTIFISI